MATAVYDIYEFELLDGKTITCRPLNIKRLREFMKEFAKMSAKDEVPEGEEAKPEDNDRAIQVLLKCAFVAFKQYAPEYTLSQLEEVLDMPTLYRIIEVASGIKMGGTDEGNA